MAALAIDDYIGTPEELLKQAQQATKRARRVTDAECSKVPALLLAAVNKRLAEIAPDQEPYLAVKRLATEREGWDVESTYQFLTEYCEKSMRSSKVGPAYELIDHEEFVWIAEGLLTELNERNA